MRQIHTLSYARYYSKEPEITKIKTVYFMMTGIKKIDEKNIKKAINLIFDSYEEDKLIIMEDMIDFIIEFLLAYGTENYQDLFTETNHLFSIDFKTVEIDEEKKVDMKTGDIY